MRRARSAAQEGARHRTNCRVSLGRYGHRAGDRLTAQPDVVVDAEGVFRALGPDGLIDGAIAAWVERLNANGSVGSLLLLPDAKPLTAREAAQADSRYEDARRAQVALSAKGAPLSRSWGSADSVLVALRSDSAEPVPLPLPVDPGERPPPPAETEGQRWLRHAVKAAVVRKQNKRPAPAPPPAEPKPRPTPPPAGPKPRPAQRTIVPKLPPGTVTLVVRPGPPPQVVAPVLPPRLPRDSDVATHHPEVVRDAEGHYVALGPRPHPDPGMPGRLRWMERTRGGELARADDGDDSPWAQEWRVHLRRLGRRVFVGAEPVDDRRAGLGDPGSLTPVGPGDQHACEFCQRTFAGFAGPGVTYLGHHVYGTDGNCPYLRSRYGPEALRAALGLERYRRGFVAHPEAVQAAATDQGGRWPSDRDDRLYLVLAGRARCYMCGLAEGEHEERCQRRSAEASRTVSRNLATFRFGSLA